MEFGCIWISTQMVIKMKILFLCIFIDNISDHDIEMVFDLIMGNEQKKGWVFEIKKND